MHINFISKLKKKNYLNSYRKEFDKIQHLFMIKKITTSKLGVEGNFFNLGKGIYQNHQSSYSVMLKMFPLKSGTRQERRLMLILFNIVLEVLASMKDKKKV